jgi:hypothetical protein
MLGGTLRFLNLWLNETSCLCQNSSSRLGPGLFCILRLNCCANSVSGRPLPDNLDFLTPSALLVMSNASFREQFLTKMFFNKNSPPVRLERTGVCKYAQDAELLFQFEGEIFTRLTVGPVRINPRYGDTCVRECCVMTVSVGERKLPMPRGNWATPGCRMRRSLGRPVSRRMIVNAS